MQMVYCDNCGCSIDNDNEGSTITINHPYYETADGQKVWSAETRTYVLCQCCATGLIQVLDGNRAQLSYLHGEDCCDIHSGRVPCACNPGTIAGNTGCGCGGN